MASWRDVRRIALSLEGTSERSSEPGKRAWEVGKKLLAWERPLRRSDLEALGNDAPTGDILGVRTPDLEMKEALLASDPRVFFATPHFDGYSAVLIRLAKIAPKNLESVLIDCWLSRAPARVVKAYLLEHATIAAIAKPRSKKSGL